MFVGLSGGVDSAVSAALLKKEGYDVTGVFIKIAIEGYPCPAAEDRRSAMRVAAHLDIPFLEIDLSEEYEKEVFRISLNEFSRGRTPNPDTLCNREIKFGKFFDFAMSRGADYIATGHYARVTSAKPASQRSSDFLEDSARPFAQQVSLLVGIDSEKDQSYFLWAVPETQLRRTLFPVGTLQKPQVRALAKKFGLPNATRPDSQGLCFLGDISISDMLVQELETDAGNVLAEDGTIIGRHRGAMLYTPGQRHGFELLAHIPHTSPYFVISKDVEHNTIVVSTSRFPAHAKKTVITLTDTNWIGTVESGSCMARFRYRQTLIPAECTITPEKTTVTLLQPHYVPLGQSVVLYCGERCVGGGSADAVYLS